MSFDVSGCELFPDVSRLEVIGKQGRELVEYGVTNLIVALQDNGKTLKIFYSKDEDLEKQVIEDMTNWVDELNVIIGDNPPKRDLSSKM